MDNCTPPPAQPRNPLHGITLETIVTALADHYGWAGLAQRVPVRCFSSQPSVASSLKFLRKTPWARDKVESLYVARRTAVTVWSDHHAAALRDWRRFGADVALVTTRAAPGKMATCPPASPTNLPAARARS